MKRYTIKEFFESDEKLALHTPTEEEALKLCNAFADAGYSWADSSSYKHLCNWHVHKDSTAYSNRGFFCTEGFYSYEGCTVLTVNDIIFEDDEESKTKDTKEYKVKIEVRKVDDRYNLYINNAEFCYWSKTVSLDVITCTLISYIVGQEFTQPSETQDYLLENHYVDTSTIMTLKEIEEKLGVKNLKIIGDDD